MGLSPQLKQKLSGRFGELIQEGEAIAAKLHGPRGGVPSPIVVEWGTKCASLLLLTMPRNHPRYQDIKEFGTERGCLVNPPKQVGLLKAVRDDFDRGFLDDLGEQIEAEIASDYMGQAEQLLVEGQSGKYDHVPAAILTGAVLENALRKLCLRQSPEIPTTKAKSAPYAGPPYRCPQEGKRGQANRGGAAKIMGAHSHKAAHGEFDQFHRQQVESMIAGVRDFLARHM